MGCRFIFKTVLHFLNFLQMFISLRYENEKFLGAGELAQYLRALLDPLENLSSILSTYKRQLTNQV